jgi:ASC-1-like (ASCH) protein
MNHTLKTLPCYFDAVLSGDKRHEVRYNKDRGFQKGDTITLREYDPTGRQGCYTGREFRGVITYVNSYEQKDGFVVFSFRPIDVS